jgi:DNA sulfur modification protein DndC
MQPTLFENQRLSMLDSIRLTIASLLHYGPRHKHWAIAWSGGKDSTTLLTLIVYLLDSGKIPRPETLTVLYADTRLELLPLWISASQIRDELQERGVEVRTVMAPMDKRFLVYVLGRGVPPPNNNTLRWCTRQIKIDPMKVELERLAAERQGEGEREKVLVLTGVRRGESVVRDQRIALSCARNGAECGQGWYQETLPESLVNTLAPIDHWRVCHVWEWLRHWAPEAEFGDWSTAALAEAYGGDEAEENQARTGCVGCPLAQRDTALDGVLRNPKWSYLTPLKELRPLWRDMRSPLVRLRKRGYEFRQDGTPSANPQRMGPITIDGRREALARVLDIQSRINVAARSLGRPEIDLLNDEELTRIHELLDARTFPNKWDEDTDALATEVMDEILPGGGVQPQLFGKGSQ